MDRTFAVRLDRGFAMIQAEEEALDLNEVDRSIEPDDAEELELIICDPQGRPLTPH